MRRRGAGRGGDSRPPAPLHHQVRAASHSPAPL